ncbi:MAG TPA: glycine betaine ABC transporter substrate-binding protein [Oleiagrimonas sp.]|nr:glycine betaine ABC transporter substrate-binding protein [Oleiagrimonas sp.]
MNQSSTTKWLGAGIASLALALAGCSSGTGNNDAQTAAPSSTAKAGASQADHGTIKLGYVTWASCMAATNVMAATLEKAGYDVKTMSVTTGLLYAGLAQGDVDAMVCAWLPTTHHVYYAKTKDRLVNLGANMKGTKIGLTVPTYVKIDSIADLADKAVSKKFDNRIVGIDPGAGIMRATRKAIKAYNLPEKLVVGSGATMTAALGNAIRQHQPIVVTGWNPHWMWARYDLKYLEDPKGIYGKPENIDTLVRKGLKTDHPKAYRILDNFQWTADDMRQVMKADTQPGANRKADAKAWVEAHPKKVDAWLGK